MSSGPTEYSVEGENEALRAMVGQLRRQLMDSQERLHAVFETVCEAILTINHEGIIDAANEAAGRLFGYPIQELIGRNISFLMPEPYSSEHDGYLRRYLTTQEPHIIGIGREVAGKRRDGSVFPLYLSVSRVVLNDRMLFTGFVQDLSERKRHEEESARWREELERRVELRTEELERANQALEDFTYTISHDLRTPLRGIRNYVDFLKEDLAGKIPEDSAADLGRLGVAADELELMVQELLDYSRIGRSETEPEEIDVAELIENIRRAYRKELRDGIVTEGALPHLCAPQGLLRQIFQNLIENGLRYNRSELPRVVVSARRAVAGPGRPPHWIFEVRDNGIGIDPKYHAKVFGMFQRLHSQEDYPGTGIGLAAVRKAVHYLGGSVVLESEPGKGSTFLIELPERNSHHAPAA